MEKNQEILQAANECFLQYGYTKTSMSDIGKKVNLNKASLYYYYKDKFSLYKEVIGIHRSKHLHTLELTLEQQESASDQILIFVQEEIKFSQRTSVILTNGNNNIYDTKMETKEVYDEIIKSDVKRLEKILQEGVKQGEFVPCDENKVASSIMKLTDAMINENCPLYADELQRSAIYLQLQEELAYIIKLVLNGLSVTVTYK